MADEIADFVHPSYGAFKVELINGCKEYSRVGPDGKKRGFIVLSESRVSKSEMDRWFGIISICEKHPNTKTVGESFKSELQEIRNGNSK